MILLQCLAWRAFTPPSIPAIRDGSRGAEGPPEPAAYDRLPLEWNKRTVKRFKDRLAERDLDAGGRALPPPHSASGWPLALTRRSVVYPCAAALAAAVVFDACPALRAARLDPIVAEDGEPDAHLLLLAEGAR